MLNFGRVAHTRPPLCTQTLLEDSKFKPRKLKKEQRSKLVDALTAMEDAYPADAKPLGDPALSGQWSVVYSSSSRVRLYHEQNFFGRCFSVSSGLVLFIGVLMFCFVSCRFVDGGWYWCGAVLLVVPQRRLRSQATLMSRAPFHVEVHPRVRFRSILSLDPCVASSITMYPQQERRAVST